MKTTSKLIILVLTFLALATGAVDLPGGVQAAAAGAVRTVKLTASDGRAFEAAYSPASAGKATLLLLHGGTGKKEEWEPLSRALTREGYGVLAPDLRRAVKGSTAVRGDIANEGLLWDIEAAMSWLNGAGVPDSAIGLVGADLGATLAAKYGNSRPQIGMLALLSPPIADYDVPVINAVRRYYRRQIRILVAYATGDKSSSRDAPGIVKFAKQAVGDQNVKVITVPTGRGTAMFESQPSLAGDIVSWVTNPVNP